MRLQCVAKSARGVDRVLPRHAVHDEQTFVRTRTASMRRDFLHHLRIHMQTPRCVHNQHVIQSRGALASGAAAAMSSAPESALDGKKPTSICWANRSSCRMAAGRCTSALASSTRLRFWDCNQRASFAAVVVLPAPCKPGEQHDERWLDAKIEANALPANGLHQFFVNDLDEGLSRSETATHLSADRACLHGFDEGFDHWQRDVRFEQSDHAPGAVRRRCSLR